MDKFFYRNMIQTLKYISIGYFRVIYTKKCNTPFYLSRNPSWTFVKFSNAVKNHYQTLFWYTGHISS